MRWSEEVEDSEEDVHREARSAVGECEEDRFSQNVPFGKEGFVNQKDPYEGMLGFVEETRRMFIVSKGLDLGGANI